jgi:hypothetical protein
MALLTCMVTRMCERLCSFPNRIVRGLKPDARVAEMKYRSSLFNFKGSLQFQYAMSTCIKQLVMQSAPPYPFNTWPSTFDVLRRLVRRMFPEKLLCEE